MAHAESDCAGPDTAESQFLYSDDSADHDDLHCLWDADSEPGLPAGFARLYRLESGGCDGAARTRVARVDVPARQYRKTRPGYPPAGGDRVCHDRHRELAVGQPQPQYVDVGLHEANDFPGHRD